MNTHLRSPSQGQTGGGSAHILERSDCLGGHVWPRLVRLGTQDGPVVCDADRVCCGQVSWVPPQLGHSSAKSVVCSETAAAGITAKTAAAGSLDIYVISRKKASHGTSMPSSNNWPCHFFWFFRRHKSETICWLYDISFIFTKWVEWHHLLDWGWRSFLPEVASIMTIRVYQKEKIIFVKRKNGFCHYSKRVIICKKKSNVYYATR